MGEKIIKDFASCIHRSLHELDNDIVIGNFFNGFMQSDEFKFFNSKEYIDIIHDDLRTERVNSKLTKQVLAVIDDESKACKGYTIYKSAILFFFFYIVKKEPRLYTTDFLRLLYESANKYYDVENLSDVSSAILFISIIKGKNFHFYKDQLLYWNEHKEEYKPKLNLRCTSSTMPYDEWVLKLSDGKEGDFENTQTTRASINIINTSIGDWDGFDINSENNEKTKDLVSLLLDSKQRRLYYFSVILDKIILAQKKYRLMNLEDVFEPICYRQRLIVDRLLTILNSSFDGTTLWDEFDADDTDGWALGSIKARLYAFDFIDDEDYSGNERGKRKYLRAYMIGQYQNGEKERRKGKEVDKEIIISKELLLMMILILKMYSPDTMPLDDVTRILYNSRYGDELSNSLFDEFFEVAFSNIKDLGVASSFRERLRELKKTSAYYEEISLLDNKALFAEAILGRESRDGK